MENIGASTLKKVVQSAVIIMPPKELWEPIQNIRKDHDKAYKRWMPHINLLYPFVEVQNFPAVVSNMRQALSSIQPFELTFDHFQYFKHGTLWLAPSTKNNDVKKVQAALQKEFPYCDDLSSKSKGGFTPHLSVGQFQSSQLDQYLAQFQKNWQPITWTVNEVYVISRSGFDDPFHEYYRIPFNGGEVEQLLELPNLSQQKSQKKGPDTVFVGNLHFDTQLEELKSFFVDNGFAVNNVEIRNGRFAFVTLQSASEAGRAIQELHEKTFKGRKLTVAPIQNK